MENINNYWMVLESLNFPVVGVSTDNILSDDERIQININKLQKFTKLSPQEIVESFISQQPHFRYLESRKHVLIEGLNNRFLYGLYLLEILGKIYKNVNFSSQTREDLVSEQHKSIIISSLIDLAKEVLQGILHDSFYKDKGAVFSRSFKQKTNFCQLEFVVEAFTPLLHVKELQVGKSLDDVQLSYMAAIFSLLIAKDSKEYQMEVADIVNLEAKLQKLWLEFRKSLYYRNLMLLYSTLPKAHKPRIRKEMLLRLWSKGGFIALLFAMTESQRSEEQSFDEMIASLVAQPGYSVKAQQSLIQQILEFVKASLKNKELCNYMGAGILSLRKLYDNKLDNQTYLEEWIKTHMQPLVVTSETNLIAMEWCDFIDLISLLFHIFCTSSIATLPSALLLPYLPLLLELHRQMECYVNQETLNNHIRSLILKIINNRSKDELKHIIECIVIKKYPKEWFQLYYKIQIKENPLNMQELKLSFIEVETSNMLLVKNTNHLACLITVLKSSSHNLIMYQLFLILLQRMPSLIMDTVSTSSNAELLASENDVYSNISFNISRNYEHKFNVITSLETLAHHQPLKSIINDNKLELLKALQNILIAVIANDDIKCCSKMDETVLIIIIALITEVIENTNLDTNELQGTLLKPLKELLTQVESKNLKYQINFLVKHIEGKKFLSDGQADGVKSEFEDARNLMESNESYLQVEGIEKMIKLINKRDEYAITNSHVLTILALNTLKSHESYTFLNCVRLFVALVNVNESEVLELLSDEYLTDLANMDYRLVVGEAILKICRELGPLCYKYKNVLLNTYMTGCRSPLDEFRLSAFSNLSQMCRLLTYQVHNYFQELLNLIDCEISTGKYLPAKRAAVMVLSDLLDGMDNLFDYEEMLLPIYRLLKYLAGAETSDEKLRIHASYGLKSLNDKCKELFKNALENSALEKEIKIMGIHEKPRKSLKNHILEIN